MFKSHERRAEGMKVFITEPHPRRVIVTKDGMTGGFGFQGLSIKEAEGLHYALKSALADARADGECD